MSQHEGETRAARLDREIGHLPVDEWRLFRSALLGALINTASDEHFDQAFEVARHVLKDVKP